MELTGLTKKELEELSYSSTFTNRCIAAAQGYALDRLINDSDFLVRVEVAKVTNDKKSLEKLAKDDNMLVRRVALKKLEEKKKIRAVG